MYRAATSMTVLAFFGTLVLAASAQTQEPKKNSKPKSDAVSMTGCIDEDNGRYVLINDRTRATIANLEADGFPVEGFAKHLGHKVTVRGTVNPDSNVPLVRVRSVETISETCEPQLYQ